MISCISAPSLTEDEALEAKFRAGAGAGRHKRRGSSTDMSPAFADTNDRVEFATPGGTFGLTKVWAHHELQRRSFSVRAPTSAVVATVPGTKGRKCLLFQSGDALVIYGFEIGGDGGGGAGGGNPPPIRVLRFPGTTVTAIAHRVVGDGDGSTVSDHDLLVGGATGEVWVASLRALIMEAAGKEVSLPAGTLKFNTDGRGGRGGSFGVVKEMVGGDSSSHKNTAARCTSVNWFPNFGSSAGSSPTGDGKSAPAVHSSGGKFLSTHADGNTYVYYAIRGGGSDPCFCEVRGKKAKAAVSATPANERERGANPNPVCRWRVGDTSITSAAISPNGLAVVLSGSDGIVRVLDVTDTQRPLLIDGFAAHFGGVDCVSWGFGPSPLGRRDEPKTGRFASSRMGIQSDGYRQPNTPRFVLVGGEADIVEVWDRALRAVVARGEGHCSWITAVRETRDANNGKNYSDEQNSNSEDSQLVGTMDHGSDVKKQNPNDIDHRYDDLLSPNLNSQSNLRFMSAAQDCRLCVWEVPVREKPSWWVESDRDDGRDTYEVSQNVTIPGASRDETSDGLGRMDEDDSPPVPMPTPVSFGRLPSPSTAGGESDDATIQNENNSAEAQLVFPTLRANGGGFATGVPESEPHQEAVSSKSCMGKHPGAPIAPAASRASTPTVTPTANHVVHSEPCTGLAIVEEGILTSCGGGVVKLWRQAADGG